MAKVSQAQEPSMEEILASIRRIISDDDDDTPPTAASVNPEDISTEAIDALFGVRSASLSPSAVASTPLDYAPATRAPSPVRSEPLPRAAVVPEPSYRAEPAPRPAAERSYVAPVPVRPAEPAPLPAEPRHAVVAERVVEPLPDEIPAGRPLLSPSADAAVNAAFSDLATTLLSGQARTLEDLVKDMLRPMLKSWLDTNLPPLVERLVRDEIERVSRGR